MNDANPAVVVTGVAGNLGLRLLSQLSGFQVIGVDVRTPDTQLPLRFHQLDLAAESSCRELYLLFKEYRPAAVIHLAFVIDPIRSGVLDPDLMWQINVAGTARVMEAIAEANRDQPTIAKFIFPSSVAVYGPSLTKPATEESPFAAHSLPYAVQKMECDQVVQQRAPSLRGCSVYMLRPHIFAGRSVENYLMGAFRGTPGGKSPRAEKMRHAGKRLPCMLPRGERYLNNKIQFVHVDDVARLIAFILRKPEPEARRITILNVTGDGDDLTFQRCIEMARAKLVRPPGKWAMRLALQTSWRLGISSIPPTAMPYMTGQYTMNTDRLRAFLGPDYKTVMQYKIADAFADSFNQEEKLRSASAGTQ